MNLGIYNTTANRVGLEAFQIKARVEAFTEKGQKEVGFSQKFQALLNKTIDVKYQKGNTIYGTDATGAEVMLIDGTYRVRYFSRDESNIDIVQFIKSVRQSDISAEVRQVSDSLCFGYTNRHAHQGNIFATAVKKWALENPSEFLYLTEKPENGLNYAFPSSNIAEFKAFMAAEMKSYPNHLAVLDDYCNHWEEVFNASRKKKYSAV